MNKILEWTWRFSFPYLKVWQVKDPIGKTEIIGCPICWNRLHMDQDSQTGYVCGACETPDCLAFSLPPITGDHHV